MPVNAYISEIFSSVQGEGLFVGYRQVFIRLSECTFGCPYCDTDFSSQKTFDINGIRVPNPVTAKELADLIIKNFDPDKLHSYSFTGGEPLLNADFVEICAAELKIRSKADLFLETSGLVPDELLRFDGIFDIMSVDIKTHSQDVIDNIPVLFATIKELKETFWYLKLIIPEDYEQSTIETVLYNMNKYDIRELIIQPVDNIISQHTVDKLYDIFYKSGIEPRIIPQTHKILNLR